MKTYIYFKKILPTPNIWTEYYVKLCVLQQNHWEPLIYRSSAKLVSVSSTGRGFGQIDVVLYHLSSNIEQSFRPGFLGTEG